MKRRPPVPVRWRDDTGWEFRCERCVTLQQACFWPLTDEFWDRKKGLGMCRACHRAKDAERARAAYLASHTFRERRRESARLYRKRHPEVTRLKDQVKWAAIKADPERHARAVEVSRESSRRYRERHRGEKAA